MRHSQHYNLRLPERSEGRNDPADIDDLTDGLERIDGLLKEQSDECARQERDKLDKAAHNLHKSAATLDHPDGSVTDAKLGERSIGGLRGLLQTLLEAVGSAIGAISGTERWNDPPVVSLARAGAHIAEKTNPHGVTAAQTGAYSCAETDAAVSAAIAGKADAANVLALDNTAAYTPTANYHPATKKYIDDQLGKAGSGDMMKAVYDADGDGVVDNAARVNGLTVQTAVPANAKFTDTVYTHPASHPPGIIAQTSTGRFVSDAEKTAWNAKATTARYTVTIGTGWSGSGPWTQNVAVSGITAADAPLVDVLLSGADATDALRLDNWGLVSRINTYDGGITVRCLDGRPGVILPVQIRVVR